MVKNITKRTRTLEITEYLAKCDDCGKEIVGSTEFQVDYNLKIHKGSKGCVYDK